MAGSGSRKPTREERAQAAEERRQRLWQVISAIPPGRVCSYGGVAKLAGIPNGSEILSIPDRSGFEGRVFGWHPLSHWDSPYGQLSTDKALNRRDYGRFLKWHYDRVAGFIRRLARVRRHGRHLGGAAGTGVQPLQGDHGTSSRPCFTPAW